MDTIPEPMVLVKKVSKRKKITEVAPEKSRKKIRIILLAEKEKKESAADIHVLPVDEPSLCTVYMGTTLVEPEMEKKIEDLELEAKVVLPKVSDGYLSQIFV